MKWLHGRDALVASQNSTGNLMEGGECDEGPLHLANSTNDEVVLYAIYQFSS